VNDGSGKKPEWLKAVGFIVLCVLYTPLLLIGPAVAVVMTELTYQIALHALVAVVIGAAFFWPVYGLLLGGNWIGVRFYDREFVDEGRLENVVAIPSVVVVICGISVFIVWRYNIPLPW
jgi:hypothetical protein